MRAGSGACGVGIGTPPREALANGVCRDPRAANPVRAEEVKAPSDPPVRQYDRAACFDGLRADVKTADKAGLPP
jgi:hypothetical protein